MKPGRDLDAFIAEKVMGEKNDGTLHLWVPRYSLSMDAAWEVVEKLTVTTKQWLRLEQHPTGCTATFELSGAGDKDAEWSAEAITAPHAICLAALKAVDK